MINNSDTWHITPEDRSKHDLQFQSLKPIGGFINGEQAKNFFVKSALPTAVLGQIWGLADLDKDGRMDKKEFSIAMFLIKKRLEGAPLPTILPESLKQDSTMAFQPSSVVSAGYSTLPSASGFGAFSGINASQSGMGVPHNGSFPMYQSSGGTLNMHTSSALNMHSGGAFSAVVSSSSSPITSAVGLDDWTIPQQLRPRYRLQFNQHDRQKRGYLTGAEARGVLVQSGLPQHILAQIWNLADYDSDGNLTFEEFCIAMFLVDQARSGVPLPSVLPPSLYPGAGAGRKGSLVVAQGGHSGSGSVSSEAEAEPQKTVTIEDKRRENFLKGQAELEKRQALLREQMQQEEEARMAKERAEQERREKIRLEKERQRQAELDRQLERQRQLDAEREAERKRQEEEQEKARREAERQRLLDQERKRMDAALMEKSREQTAVEQASARQTKLQEELSTVSSQRQELLTKLGGRVGGIDAGLRAQKEGFDSETRNLEAQLEAAKAELNHWQREREKLSFRLQTSAESDPVTEQFKALKASYDSKRTSTQDLKEQIVTMENDMTRKGQELATKRNKVHDLDRKLKRMSTDLTTLQNSVLSKMIEWERVGHKRSGQQAFKTKTNSMDKFGDAFSSAGFDSWSNVKTATRTWDSGAKVTYYQAVYDFAARQTDELNFSAGAVIAVNPNPEVEVSSGWLYGELNGKSGLFPEAYVQPCDPPSKKQPATEEVYEEVAESTSSVLKSVVAGPAPNTVSMHTNFLNSITGTKSVEKLAQKDSGTMEFCVALYQYSSGEPGDLVLQAGDVIKIDTMDQDWWEGTVAGTDKKGLFPANFVKKMSLKEMEASGINVTAAYALTERIEEASMASAAAAQVPVSKSNGISETPAPVVEEDDSVYANIDPPPASSTPAPALPSSVTETVKERTASPATSTSHSGKSGANKPEIAKVIVPYKATGVEQLSLEIGQLIQIRKRSETGWWEGELQQRGQKRRIGWFPAEFVRVLNSVNEAGQPTSRPGSRGPKQEVATEQVIAIYAYAAQNVDELTFEKNAIITVIGKDEPEWWRGRLPTGAEGLFPVNYIRKVLPPSSTTHSSVSNPTSSDTTNTSGDSLVFDVILTDNEKKRQYSIFELIDTEKAYYNDLREVFQVFYTPFKDSGLFTPEELGKVFINWADLLPNSFNFYMALKIRKDNSGVRQPIQCVGDILVSNFPNFVNYVRFCSCQNHALSVIQKKLLSSPKFKELCAKCEQNTRARMMPFTSYLLKPLQRITKYKLLVENILKYTDAYHPDLGDMEEATAAARSLCEAVNNGVREQENSERLEWLQERVQCEGLNEKLYFNSQTNCLGNRRLLKSGTLYKAKSNREIIAFLFNDFLLLTTPGYNTGGQPFIFPSETSAKSNHKFKMYKKPIFLNFVLVQPGLPGQQPLESPDIFTINEPNLIQSFKTQSSNDRTRWIEILQSSSREYLELEKSKKIHSMSITRSAGVGRLLVTIVEGINLKSESSDGKVDAYCEVTLGNQCHKTKVIPSTLSPRWNASMQFQIKHVEQDVLCLTIYDKDYFTPNDFLGRTEVRLSEIVREKEKKGTVGQEPLEKRLRLMEVESGEIVIKLDLQMFETDEETS